MTGSAGISR